jgi:membrane protease YdiL (CAAX protease family)
LALKFKCPKCSRVIISKFCRPGENVKCRQCDAEITIPEDAESTEDESTLIIKSGSVVEKAVDKIITEAEILKGKRYPGVIQAIWLLILMLILHVALVFPVTCLAFTIRRPLHMNPATISAISIIVLGLILRIGYNRSKSKFHEVFPLSPIRTLFVLPMIITLVGCSVTHSGLISIVITLIPAATEFSQYTFSRYLVDFVYRNPIGATLVLVASVPFLEEFLFRGLMLRGFLNRYTTRKAILVSSLLFAVYHINIFLVVHAFVLGLLFAWWFVKTRSLLPCILGHLLNNSLALVSMAMFYPATGDETESATLMPWWLFVSGIIILILGILLTSRMFGQTNPKLADSPNAAM